MSAEKQVAQEMKKDMQTVLMKYKLHEDLGLAVHWGERQDPVNRLITGNITVEYTLQVGSMESM